MLGAPDTTACLLERGNAIMNNQTDYIPECDPHTGQYKVHQCKVLDGFKVCFCVGPRDGNLLRGTFNVSAEEDCAGNRALVPRVCLPFLFK